MAVANTHWRVALWRLLCGGGVATPLWSGVATPPPHSRTAIGLCGCAATPHGHFGGKAKLAAVAVRCGGVAQPRQFGKAKLSWLGYATRPRRTATALRGGGVATLALPKWLRHRHGGVFLLCFFIYYTILYFIV